VPLFPSYLFICGSFDDRLAALKTNRVVRILNVPNQHELSEELTELSRALRKGANLDLHPELREGRRCRIVAGPFEGLDGTVISRRNRARFILQVSFIGQGAAMEIDADLLEPIDQ
jgi:transcription antitermination factor NusG